MLQVRTCRGAPNRLGFALNLLLLRFLHCPLPELTLTPACIVHFVAMQLNIHPDVLAEYSARRSQTRDEHMVQIRDYLGLRSYSREQDDSRLSEYLFARALQRDDPGVLLEEAEEWLREEAILFPAESTIQRIIAQVRPQAEHQLFAVITDQLNVAQWRALEELLLREQGKRGSTLAWLKEPPVRASPASIKILLSKLQTVREIGVGEGVRESEVDLSRLNRNRVRVLAHLGEKYHRDSLQRFSRQKRAALMVCYLQSLQQELLDGLLTSFNDLVGGIFRRNERKEDIQYIKQGPALNRHIHTFRKMVRIVLDNAIPDAEVRPRIFAVIPATQLQQDYDDSGERARPEDGQAFDLLEAHYTFLRKFMPDVLTALEFSGTSAAKHVVAAIEALRQMDAQGRRRLPVDAPMKSLMVCYLQSLQQELLDGLLTSFNDLVGGIFRRNERKEDIQYIKQGPALNRHIHTFRKMVRIVLDNAIPDAEVRPRIFAVIPATQLQQDYDDSGERARPEDGQAFDLLEAHYTFLRKFMPDVLTALEFSGTSAAKHVVAAIEALRQMDAQGRRRLPVDAPMKFLPADWSKAIDAAIDSGDGVTAKHLWELCLAEQMRRYLRSSDLSVPGSWQHKVWTSYLHSPVAWEQRRDSWFIRWHGPAQAEDYLDMLEERYRATLEKVLENWDQNDFAQITYQGGKSGKNGKASLDLSRDEKIPVPVTAEQLKEAILKVLPHARLADVLIEVDDWVGLQGHFTHLNDRVGGSSTGSTGSILRDPRLGTALFAAILAHGLNLPLTTMSAATDIPYHELTHVSDWYLREETIRRAIVALVDYHHNLPLSAAFGPGTTAMADGLRFEVNARSLHAQYHARYFGRRRGVTLHDMVSDQYSHPYIQIISPHMREAHAALDAVLHHETELPIREVMVDTSGFTELMYALYDLQGLVLSPRVRDLPGQRLYPLAGKAGTVSYTHLTLPTT